MSKVIPFRHPFDVCRHVWTRADRLALAARLNGVVDDVTGDIHFTGLLGGPETVLFGQDRLWGLETPDRTYRGQAAAEEIRRRIHWLNEQRPAHFRRVSYV